MTHSGALEAIDRILNRGGEADQVLREMLAVLSRLYAYAGVSFVENDKLVLGPTAGTRPDDPARFSIVFRGSKVAELEVAPATGDDRSFLERVALLVSPYCLVAWDTGGVSWDDL